MKNKCAYNKKNERRYYERESVCERESQIERERMIERAREREKERVSEKKAFDILNQIFQEFIWNYR